jgi:hypothetical protein
MRIANGPRARPAPRPRSAHVADASHRHARPKLRHQRTERQASPTGARHLPAGTARRALHRNLAHLQSSLRDPRLPQPERRLLEQSVATLETRLQDHRTLRTNMAAMILG